MKPTTLKPIALLALLASLVSSSLTYAQQGQLAADDPSVEPTNASASDEVGTSIPSPNTDIPYAGSSLEGTTPPAASDGSAPASDASASAAPAPATSVTAPQPATAYAPDDSGLTVRKITETDPVLETVVGKDGQPVTQEATVEIPAMEIDFPGAGGNATVEFPTAQGEDGAMMGADDTISVDFPEEEVRRIIRNVADLYDLNVVIPDTLAGSTTIKLRNVTWRQVFEVVLEPLGYTYVEDRNIIKIKSVEELTTEQPVTRVFLINYAVAEAMQGSLAPLIDSSLGGRVQVDKRTNALLVTERPSRMNDIQLIIERLDRPNPQVMIESKFIEINNEDASDIGVNWASLQNYTLTAGPFNRQYDSSSSKISDNAYDSNSGNGTDFTNNNVDVNGVVTNTTTNLVNRYAESSMTGGLNWIDEVTRTDTAVFSADAFNVVLSFLESNTDAKLVNNPTLVTLDGEEAKLVIGEQFPIPSYTFNDETGSFEVSGFEYKDIGTVMAVTPNVNSAGFIRLRVEPELSRSDRTTTFGGSGQAEIPIITTTQTKSNVILKDGYTLAIGGLIETLTNDVDTSVPYLSEIPLLGELFQHSAKSTTRRNLLIFITAKTLNASGTSYKDIVDPRTLYEMGILANEIPGYELPDEQRQAYEDIMNLQTRFSNDKAQMDLLEKVSKLNEETEKALNGSEDETEE